VITETIRTISRETLLKQNIQRRIKMLEAVTTPPHGVQAADFHRKRDWMLRELYDEKIPMLTFPEGFDFKKVTKETSQPGMLAEITLGSFAQDFSQRRAYEVDAGRDEEPIVYTAIYDQQVDANFDEVLDIFTLGPVGVVMSEIKDGGEVTFMSVGEGNHSIRILQYATGLRYTQKLMMYNKTWMIGPMEREVGKANNALHNFVHLNPIITATYGAGNQTAASALGTTLYEKVANTIDDAITASVTDTTNPRRGPYVILCSSADLTKIERALQGGIPQQGFNLRPSTMGRVNAIIAYDGWSGTQGKKPTSYAGVTAGKCYLVNVGQRRFDFQSKVKIPFREQRQAGDLKRFIAEEIVYDTHFGMYANPTRAVEEVTLPTS
jgi:hypothetical protein